MTHNQKKNWLFLIVYFFSQEWKCGVKPNDLCWMHCSDIFFSRLRGKHGFNFPLFSSYILFIFIFFLQPESHLLQWRIRRSEFQVQITPRTGLNGDSGWHMIATLCLYVHVHPTDKSKINFVKRVSELTPVYQILSLTALLQPQTIAEPGIESRNPDRIRKFLQCEW